MSSKTIEIVCENCGKLRASSTNANPDKYRREHPLCIKCASDKSRPQALRTRRKNDSARRWAGDVSWYNHGHGYLRAEWADHPLATGKRCLVAQHWHVFWEHHKRAPWVKRAKEMKATIHHKNSIRNDNRIENLELCWPGRHPKGWTTKAMIETLEMMGYEVKGDSGEDRN